MTHIGHLFDGSAGWEQRVGISQLLDRLPRDRYVNSLAAVEPAARAPLRHLNRPVEVLPRFTGLYALSAPTVSRFVGQRGIDLIHAWGVHAAAAARAAIADTGTPLVIHLFDPVIAKREAKLLQTLARPEKFAVACSCEIVRRRLIESGLAPELAVVIRPGVDFALINKCRRGSLREELGARGDDYVVIVPEPVTRTGGQFEGVWATTLLNHLSGGIRLIIPGESREQRRIARFAGALPVSVPLVMPGSRYPFEELLTASDALLITPRGDISTTSIAWATAAGVAVIAAAVPPIAELISNKLNGLLFKQTPGRSMAAAIVRFLRDRESQEKVKEAARGWAYEVFSLHRYVEQTMRLYENVVSGATLKVKQALPGCFVGNYTGGEA